MARFCYAPWDDFVRTCYINYFPIHFLKKAAPIHELVKSHCVEEFKHWCLNNPATAPEVIARMKQQFPSYKWLQKEWISSLLLDIKIDLPYRECDFQDCEIEAIKSALHTLRIDIPVMAILNCSLKELEWLGADLNVTGLDLRGCNVSSWHQLEPILSGLNRLNYVVMPLGITSHPTDFFGSYTFRPEIKWVHHENSLPINNLLLSSTSLLSKLEFHSSTLSFQGLPVITTELLNRLTPQIRDLRGLQVDFAYCSNITNDIFRWLAELDVHSVSFFGCDHVTDPFIEPLLKMSRRYKRLDLRGTRVSKETAEELRAKNILVDHDPDFLKNLERIERGVTAQAERAHKLYESTGYYPQVSASLAMELIQMLGDELGSEKLERYCRWRLLLAISRENVADLHAFAVKTNDRALEYYTYYFLLLLCDPFKEPCSKEKEILYKTILLSRAPDKCEGKMVNLYERQQIRGSAIASTSSLSKSIAQLSLENNKDKDSEL